MHESRMLKERRPMTRKSIFSMAKPMMILSSIAAMVTGTTGCLETGEPLPTVHQTAALVTPRTRGPHDAIPVVDLGLSQEALILMLDFESRDLVKFKSAAVGPGRARGHLAEPPLLRFRIKDTTGALLDEFNAWHPLWVFHWQGSLGSRRESKFHRPQAPGRFVLPFYPTLTQVELYDVPRNQLVFSGSMADLGILSLETITPPTEIIAGTPVNITVEASVENAGPAGPIDVLLTTTAVGDTGGSVTPAEQASESALPAGQQRTIRQTFTVQCNSAGTHTFTFSADVQSKNVQDIDVNLSDNRAQVSLILDCVVPAAINIKPHGSANPINLRAANVPLAVLTTNAGEYGLPLDFDATSIDPLSVRFGPEALVWGGAGGPEIHARGHVEDSYELDETTRDGDLDMILHFNPRASGLSETDGRACVKGSFMSGGSMYKFFGCDDLRIVP
jgi:hypothetical protein